MSAPEQESDQTGICFADEEFLRLYPLTQYTVMDYFARSGFYDPRCNNQRLVQEQVPPHLIPERLRYMQGIEFEVVYAQPPKLFVIEKRRRATAEIAEPLARYYVSGGIIYQAPDLRSVLTAYMMKATHALAEAFAQIKDNM